MKRIDRIVNFIPSPAPIPSRLWTASVMLTAMLLCITLAFCQEKKTLLPEQAMMRGYVEDYFQNNARDITMRKTLEWGEVKTDEEGKRTIRYKFEALIWDKDRIIFNSDFTFDKDGNYVSMVHVDGFPQPAEKPDVTTLEGVKKLVEKFFSQNFRDITSRKTVSWGELEKHEDGNVSLVYRYEATIWEENVTLDERRFVFDKEGKFVSCERTSKDFPQTIGKVENKWDVSTLEAVQKLVEKFFTQNYRDITSRKMIRWGELEKHEDGGVSLVYCYEAAFRNGNKTVREERFTFDKNGKFVNVENLKPEQKSNDGEGSTRTTNPLLQFLTPAWILEQEAQERPMYDDYWNDRSLMISYRMYLNIGRDGGKWLDVTPEQKKQFRFLGKPQEIGVEWFQKKQAEQDPELMKAYEDAQNAKPKGDPQLRRATDEQKRAYVKAAGKSFELFHADVNRELGKVLTPEQLEKLQSLEFLLLPEIGIACPAMFDCLGLSDEQKTKVAAIREELRPEFEKLLDGKMEARRLFLEKMVENVFAFDKETPIESQGELSEAMTEGAKQANIDKMVSQKQTESLKQSREFFLRLKNRLEELLTPEQKAKMQTMIDDAPDFARQFSTDSGDKQ